MLDFILFFFGMGFVEVKEKCKWRPKAFFDPFNTFVCMVVDDWIMFKVILSMNFIF